MAKENLSVHDLQGMEDLTILAADTDRIILESRDDQQFIIIRPAQWTFTVAFLKEVKTKS